MSERREINFTDAEVLHLSNMGYCNVGNGNIARTTRRDVREAVARNYVKCGLDSPGEMQHSSAHQKAEHLFRCHLAEHLRIGPAAERFPDSRTAQTLYVHISPEDQRKIDEIRNNVANGVQYTLKYISAHDYSADALF